MPKPDQFYGVVPSNETLRQCKFCGVHEKKDKAGLSNMSSIDSVCLNCLLGQYR